MDHSLLKFTSVFIDEHRLSKNTFHSILRQQGYRSFGRQLTPGMENGLCKVMGFEVPHPKVDIIYPPKLEIAPPERKNLTFQKRTHETKAEIRRQKQKSSDKNVREVAGGGYTFVYWSMA